MSKVHFASVRMKSLKADASLPAKFKRMLAEYPLKEMFEGKSVALKMHLGFSLGYTTIPPIFVKILADAVRDAGGRPFVTDATMAIATAKDRGYTSEVLGVPIVPAGGFDEKYYINTQTDYPLLKDVELAGEIVNVDAMIVFSHGKGHGYCGFGGCIKNIGMGNVTGKTRRDIHALCDTEFEWNEELCTHCYLCRDNCPTEALKFDDGGKFHIFPHHCRYCMHCVTACPQNAITINLEGARQFQAGMAHVNKACLNTFEKDRVMYINYVCNVTPICDCWGYSPPTIVPDVGIFAGTDLVSVEQAAIDSIKTENYIPGSLPHPFEVRDVEGHLFTKIFGKDPYMQCEECARLGLGEQEYEIVEVD